MANIQNELNNIKNAVYGKDVRDSIHDAIKTCYDDASIVNNNANMEVKMARGVHSTLRDRLNKSDEKQKEISSQLEHKASKDDVAKISTGTPLFASSKSEMTDTTKNYVNITDGYIYIYNNNSWEKTNIKYQSTGLSDNQVTKNKINGSNNVNITSNFTFIVNTMIDYTGQCITHGSTPYTEHKAIKFYKFSDNEILKIKIVEGGYSSSYKYMLYDSEKNFISGSGTSYENISKLSEVTLVKKIDDYLIFDFKAIKKIYSNAIYVCFTFLNDEHVEILDISKKSLDWLDISKNEKIIELENTIVNKKLKYEKPFVIFSFDWYGRMYEKRYQILKGEYGYNATFCLDNQTSDYELDSYLTREQFNEMIENGWDYALYGGVGDRGLTEESWTNHIKGIIDQKESIGIFNPVMYNAPDNNNSDIVSNAVKNNGMKLHRCTTSDNLLKSPNQFKTGANFLTSTNLTTLKTQIDKAIENKCGLVVYTHMVIPDGDTQNDGQDATQGHCYEWAFREILDYIKERVCAGELEVLTASEYYNKYNNIDSVEYDKNREAKRFNYLCNKLNLS